jgi:asparagine synthase (glutamine-hydrolysing)
VTVALSGDGGDELFAGYERYIQGERLITGVARVPPALRSIAGAGIRLRNAGAWERAYKAVAPIVDRAGRHRLAGEKIRKLGNLLEQRSATEMYRSLLSAGWQQPSSILGRPTESAGSPVERLLDQYRQLPLLDAMLLTDQQTYLADDLLAKVDRASMAVSLEARVPLLDHRVVEFSWQLQRNHKIRNGRGKWALRQVLYGLVDPALVDRPKTGFSVPLAAWLRAPLREWAEALLFDRTARADDWFAIPELRRRWAALLGGGDQEALGMWAVLMFQAWRQRWSH